jgi:hypothetical protein
VHAVALLLVSAKKGGEKTTSISLKSDSLSPAGRGLG